jgi:RNA polymerase sigma-70 factor (sigma-E family)
LVGLAALLLHDASAGEDIVQEAYVRVAAARKAPDEPELLRAYLHRTVVNLARSTLRRRLVAARYLQRQPGPVPTDDHTYPTLDAAIVVPALKALPRRQREALVLRYYGDLSEAETAAAMGVSVGTVKSTTARALHALEAKLASHE